MPIIQQVVGTRRRKLGPSDQIRSLDQVQERDEALYKVRFRNIEQPGGGIGFYYRGHGRTIYNITLDDNEVCDLPLGLIMKMRSGCKSPGTPNVRVKDSSANRGGSEVSAINQNSFNIRADGSGIDGAFEPGRTSLYMLEFVSNELEQLESLWNGVADAPSAPVILDTQALEKRPGRPRKSV